LDINRKRFNSDKMQQTAFGPSPNRQLHIIIIGGLLAKTIFALLILFLIISSSLALCYKISFDNIQDEIDQTRKEMYEKKKEISQLWRLKNQAWGELDRLKTHYQSLAKESGITQNGTTKKAPSVSRGSGKENNNRINSIRQNNI